MTAGNPSVYGAGRGIAHSDKARFFEIACQNGEGYILVTNRIVRFDQPVQGIPCLAIQPDAMLTCKLTDTASTLQALQQFVTSRAQNCTPTAHRLVGVSPSGNMVFEVRCQSGDGYLVRRTLGNNFDTLLACSNKAISGACSLNSTAGHTAPKS